MVIGPIVLWSFFSPAGIEFRDFAISSAVSFAFTHRLGRAFWSNPISLIVLLGVSKGLTQATSDNDYRYGR